MLAPSLALAGQAQVWPQGLYSRWPLCRKVPPPTTSTALPLPTLWALLKEPVTELWGPLILALWCSHLPAICPLCPLGVETNQQNWPSRHMIYNSVSLAVSPSSVMLPGLASKEQAAINLPRARTLAGQWTVGEAGCVSASPLLAPAWPRGPYASRDGPVRVTPRLLFEPVWFPKLEG